MPDHEWPQRLAEQIGAQVSRIRRQRNMTAQQLAERTTQLGHEFKRSTLANLENGNRGVSVADLLALAGALDVSPLELVWPLDLDKEVEPLPRITTDAWTAARWWRGTWTRPDRYAESEYGPDERPRLVPLLERHDQTVNELLIFYSIREEVAQHPDALEVSPSFRDEFVRIREEHLQQVRASAQLHARELTLIRDTLRNQGAPAPELPEELVAILKLLTGGTRG